MSKLYDDASLMMIPSSVKDGKLYNVLPQPKPLSGELVTNGTFDTDSDWTKGTGWTISDGKAKVNGTNTFLEQPSVIKQSAFYKVSFTMSDYVSGQCRIALGGYSTDPVFNANGDYNVYVESNAASNTRIYMYAQNASNFSIDNLSIVEVDQLDADFTFSRGSNLAATRINEQGLIEKGRENLLLQSNQFDTTWFATNTTTPTNGFSGYDGSNDAWKLKGGAGFPRVQQALSQSGVQTFSVYAKAGEVDHLRLLIITGSNQEARFDLTNGTIPYEGGTELLSKKITAVGNGWFKCQITINGTGSSYRFYAMENSTTFASSEQGVYIQDAQLEVGLVATDYIESGATTGKAGVLEDLPRLNWGGSCPSLLLEPSRQNLITHSEYIDGISGISKIGSSIDTNVTTSPEGLLNALFLKEDTSNGTHFFYKDFNLTNGSTYTISIFAKSNGENRNFRFGDGGVGWSSGFTGDFNLTNGTASGGTIENYGNGWYRCSVTGTTNATTSRLLLYSTLNTNTSYQGDGSSGVYLYGFQLEEGSYATSYIPTHGTSVTRSNDFFKIINQESLFSANEGTFFVEFSFNENNKYIGVGDSWASDKVTIGLNSSGTNQIRSIITNNGSTINLQGSGTTLGENIKACVSYGLDGFKLFMNGSLQASNSTPANLSQFSDLIPNVDVRDLSSTSSSGNIKQIVVFPTTLSDNECINLTSI